MTSTPKPFSPELTAKIDLFWQRKKSIRLGTVDFSSSLLLAPMSGICYSAFRQLMQDLGAGGSVSEFISCHGINYGNKKSLEMLYIDPQEKNVGIQLFGENGEALARAAREAQEAGAKFVDINMGCPVKKVVGKGGGSALLKNINDLPALLNPIKKALKIPLTIKIRLGWDQDQINGDEIIKIAHGEGVEFVAIHGRTRTQQYRGRANWETIDSWAQHSPLPIIGNGDLHNAEIVQKRLIETKCQALMIARGCLRHPFIFLESYREKDDPQFNAKDHYEIIERFASYLSARFNNERTIVINLRKFVVWFASGLPHSAQFRGQIFTTQNLTDVMNLAQDYFLSLNQTVKVVESGDNFMCGGHG